MSTDVEEALEKIKAADKPVAPKVMIPAPDTVELPIGYLTARGVVTTAQVRELNGYDEEAFSRAGVIGAALVAVLDRAVVKIGDDKATPEIMRNLFMADRQALLVAISRVTWGDKVRVSYLADGELQDGEYDLSELPTTKGDANDGWFEVTTPSGKLAKCHWAMGEIHEAILLGKQDKNAATFTTLVLKSCVDELDGLPLIGDWAQRLGMQDRQFLAKEILNRGDFGPQFSQTKITIPSGEEITGVLSLTDMFPL